MGKGLYINYSMLGGAFKPIVVGDGRQAMASKRTTGIIRQLCRKTTVLSYRRCPINTGVEKMNSIQILIGVLTTRCL
jgi:hypothetical protein